MGGFAGFLERIIGGRASDIGPGLLRLNRQGDTGYASGTALADEGVAGFRNLGNAYERILRTGEGGGSVLPGSTQAALKRARGQITDTNTRDIAASAARLRQARIGSGGRLSAEAAQEYMTEAEIEANRAAQEAGVSLSGQEAGLELQETNTLRDRLAQAREMILGEGGRRMALGQAAQIAGFTLRHNRSAAIASTIAATTGGIKGG